MPVRIGSPCQHQAPRVYPDLEFDDNLLVALENNLKMLLSTQRRQHSSQANGIIGTHTIRNGVCRYFKLPTPPCERAQAEFARLLSRTLG